MLEKRRSEQLNYQIYLFLILFAYTDGFGLRGEGMWGGLGNASMGPFGLLQLGLFFVSIYYMVLSLGPLFKQQTKASTATKWFLLLFVLIILQLFFQSLFIDIGKLSKLANVITLKHWILLFSVPVLYQRISLKGIIDCFKLGGFISALIVLYVIIFNVENTAIAVKMGSSVTHAMRVMVPTAPLITFAFYLFLSSFKKSRSWMIDVLGVLICFLGTFIQLHRSSTASLILITVLFFILEFKFNVGRMIVLISGGLVVLSLLFSAVGYSFEMLGDVFSASRELILTGDDAGTSMRFGLVTNGLKYVLSNYIILGIGLDWVPITDPEMYGYLQFAECPTADNGFFNIILVFGILGLFIFVNMLIRLFMSAYKSKNRFDMGVGYSIISTSVFYYFCYNTLVSMGGDRFWGDAVFPMVIGIILMNEKLRNMRPLLVKRKL